MPGTAPRAPGQPSELADHDVEPVPVELDRPAEVAQGVGEPGRGPRVGAGLEERPDDAALGRLVEVADDLPPALVLVEDAHGRGPHAGGPDQRQELARLVGELKTALAAVPPEQAQDAATVAKRVEALAEEAGSASPDAEYVSDLGASLKRAAGKLATAAPRAAGLVAAIVKLVSEIMQ